MNYPFCFATACFLLSAGPSATADYRDDVGYTALKTALASAVPTGAGVAVAQVEASIATDPALPTYAPDSSLAEFSGKTFSYPGSPSVGYSGHATGVARLFFGNTGSLATGITAIKSRSATEWLDLLYGNPNALVGPERVTNHSWVGNAHNGGAATDYNGPLLRRLDWLINRSQQIHVAAARSSPLLMNGYNAITVGQTSTTDTGASVANPSDALYGAGRQKPDLVSPFGTLSSATPVVASAVALLVEAAHGNPALSAGSSNVTGVGIVHHAERPETVKALLLAGASRATANTTPNTGGGQAIADITDYRSAGHRAANGLDLRYGAGQLNVHDSYRILAAGEQNSVEDGGARFDERGFDYDPGFGGQAGSNALASYRFNSAANGSLTAALVWPISVSAPGFAATLHHLKLALFDTTDNSAGTQLIASESAVDNTQNLQFKLLAGRRYELRVSTPDAAFSWRYALAWQIVPSVLPTVTVTSSADTVQAGESLLLTATVTGALPGGTVQFQVDGAALGAPLLLVDGVASLTTTFDSPGAHAITAVYSGDLYNEAAVSAAYVVAAATTREVPLLPWTGILALAVALAAFGARRAGERASGGAGH